LHSVSSFTLFPFGTLRSRGGGQQNSNSQCNSHKVGSAACNTKVTRVSRDNTIHIVTRYGLELNLGGARFSASVQSDLGDNSASYSVGTGFLPGVKRSRRGVDQKISCIIVEYVYIYTSTPLCAFMGCSRVSLTFTFTSTRIYSFKNNAKNCKLRVSDADMRADLFLWYFMSPHQ